MILPLLLLALLAAPAGDDTIPRLYHFRCFVDWYDGKTFVINDKRDLFTLERSSVAAAREFERWFDTSKESPLRKTRGVGFRTSPAWCRRAQ